MHKTNVLHFIAENPSYQEIEVVALVFEVVVVVEFLVV